MTAWIKDGTSFKGLGLRRASVRKLNRGIQITARGGKKGRGYGWKVELVMGTEEARQLGLDLLQRTPLHKAQT